MLYITPFQLAEDSIEYQLYRIEQLFHTVEDIWQTEGDNILRNVAPSQSEPMDEAGNQWLFKGFLSRLLKRGQYFCREARSCVFAQKLRSPMRGKERDSIISFIDELSEIFSELHDLLNAIELDERLPLSRHAVAFISAQDTGTSIDKKLYNTIQSCFHTGGRLSTQAIAHMQQLPH